nr:polysialyltransferase family glycosyltransferase [uncultured Sellimonas sp.]
MIKRLIFCNTLYQLIVAIQITLSFEGYTYLILTTEMKNVEQIQKKLYKTGVIKEVVIFDTSVKKTSIQIIKECVCGVKPDGMKEDKFDEFIGFNFDLPSHAIFAWAYKKNKNISVNKMEEGLLSYHTPDTLCRALSISCKIRKMLGMENLRPCAKMFYCFAPEIYHGTLRPKQIPKIKTTDSRIREILNIVFLEKEIKPYKEKYIFLPSIYDVEGGDPIGELELAQKIASKVGIDDLIVKVHPRDDESRYIKSNLKIDRNSGIPWEVIQINLDFSDKVVITTLSGSVLNFNPVLENVGKSYYGYKLCDLDNNDLALHYRDVLEGYLNNFSLGLRNIKVLENVEEIDL